jgi:hypothetical protein
MNAEQLSVAAGRKTWCPSILITSHDPRSDKFVYRLVGSAVTKTEPARNRQLVGLLLLTISIILGGIAVRLGRASLPANEPNLDDPEIDYTNELHEYLSVDSKNVATAEVVSLPDRTKTSDEMQKDKSDELTNVDDLSIDKADSSIEKENEDKVSMEPGSIRTPSSIETEQNQVDLGLAAADSPYIHDINDQEGIPRTNERYNWFEAYKKNSSSAARNVIWNYHLSLNISTKPPERKQPQFAFIKGLKVGGKFIFTSRN